MSQEAERAFFPTKSRLRTEQKTGVLTPDMA
jgi:hypothetical protein